MKRGTTPTFSITISNDISVSNIDAAYLTFTQDGVILFEKTLSDMTLDTTNNALLCELTQTETLSFAQDKTVLYQLRFKTATKAYASDIWRTPALEILKDGEI